MNKMCVMILICSYQSFVLRNQMRFSLFPRDCFSECRSVWIVWSDNLSTLQNKPLLEIIPFGFNTNNQSAMKAASCKPIDSTSTTLIFSFSQIRASCCLGSPNRSNTALYFHQKAATRSDRSVESLQLPRKVVLQPKSSSFKNCNAHWRTADRPQMVLCNSRCISNRLISSLRLE